MVLRQWFLKPDSASSTLMVGISLHSESIQSLRHLRTPCNRRSKIHRSGGCWNRKRSRWKWEDTSGNKYGRESASSSLSTSNVFLVWSHHHPWL